MYRPQKTNLYHTNLFLGSIIKKGKTCLKLPKCFEIFNFNSIHSKNINLNNV